MSDVMPALALHAGAEHRDDDCVHVRLLGHRHRLGSALAALHVQLLGRAAFAAPVVRHLRPSTANQ